LPSNRIASLDLLKWLALVAMVLDHLSYLAPGLWADLVFPGRLAFPLFCGVIAAHAFRQPPGMLADMQNWIFLKRLILFGCLSQPFFLFYLEQPQANILFTLAIGLGLALTYHHRASHVGAWALMIALLCFGYTWRESISYGLSGVLLPMAFVYAMRERTVETWLLPATLAFSANMPNATAVYLLIVKPDLMLADDSICRLLVQAVIAALSCFLVLWLCRKTLSFKVPSITRWAYWFYPGHLLILLLLRAGMKAFS
jgi:hypothetical protein